MFREGRLRHVKNGPQTPSLFRQRAVAKDSYSRPSEISGRPRENLFHRQHSLESRVRSDSNILRDLNQLFVVYE